MELVELRCSDWNVHDTWTMWYVWNVWNLCAMSGSFGTMCSSHTLPYGSHVDLVQLLKWLIAVSHLNDLSLQDILNYSVPFQT